MNIKIDNIENKDKYINEAIYINQNILKLIKNSNKNISTYTKYIVIRIIIMAILMGLIILSQINSKDLIILSVGISITVLGIFILLIRLIQTNKIIKMRCSEETNSNIKIDDTKLILKNDNTGITVEQKWDDISFIKITKYCIIFVNKEENKTKPYIVIPIDYKDELLKGLNKYKIKKDIIGE